MKRRYLTRVQVHNHGFVQLDDYYGDDLTIINAARQSFDKYSDEITEADEGLIKYLMQHRHGTPFEAVDFRFTIKCPISVTREWHRHRIASYNEQSGRYTKLKPEFYVPVQFRKQVGKAGNYSFEPIEGELTNATCTTDMLYAYSTCWQVYEGLLEKGVAKELARNVLPVGIYTQFMFKTNLRSLLNFLSLRNHPRAMYEIREYAKVIETMVEDIVPVTMATFVANGRQAP